MSNGIGASAALCASLLLCLPAIAVELDNDDDRDYKVKIDFGHGSSREQTTYHKTKERIPGCEECVIEVEGAGKISAKGDEVVIIKNGQLSKK